MGHSIRMIDNNGQEFKLENPINVGGTIEVGGNTSTWISITYNYAWFFYKFFDKEKGIKWIYGKKGKECVERIKNMIKELTTPDSFGSGNSSYKDYWAPTPSNVKKVLDVLLEWCEKYPDGVFEGD